MKHVSFLKLVLLTLLAGGAPTACGSKVTDERALAQESNTNWLRQCLTDDDCGGERSCLCGVCTVSCESQSDCGALASEGPETLTCSTLASKVQLPKACVGDVDQQFGACVAECVSHGDCSHLAFATSCEAGVCQRAAANDNLSSDPPDSTTPDGRASLSTEPEAAAQDCAEICAAWPCEYLTRCVEGCESTRAEAAISCGQEWTEFSECVKAGTVCEDDVPCPDKAFALSNCQNAASAGGSGSAGGPLYLMSQDFLVVGEEEISRGGGCHGVSRDGISSTGSSSAAPEPGAEPAPYEYVVESVSDSNGVQITHYLDGAIMDQVTFTFDELAAGELKTVDIILPDGVHYRYVYWGGPQCIHF